MSGEKTGADAPRNLAVQVAENPGGLIVRALLAAVPGGSSASVLIEAALSKAAINKVQAVVDRVTERVLMMEREVGGLQAWEAVIMSPYCPRHPLLEFAIQRAARTDDQLRSRLIADLLFVPAPENGGDELRRHLIEAAAQMTRFELALLGRIDQIAGTKTPSELSTFLHKIDVSSDELAPVRQYSFGRLLTFALVQKSDQFGHALTGLGQKIVSAI